MSKLVARMAGEAPGALAVVGFGLFIKFVPRPVRCMLGALAAIGFALSPR